MITIEHNTTASADMRTDRERFLDDRATFRALLTSVLRWDGDALRFVQSCIVSNPLEEDPPTCIMDRFCQFAVAYHVPNLKVFIGNQVARRDVRVCRLTGKILTLPLHFQVLLGQCISAFFLLADFFCLRESRLRDVRASFQLCGSV